MKREKKIWKKFLKKMRLYIIMLAVLILTGILCCIIVWRNVLENSHDLGTSLAQNYSSEEENSITFYKTLVGLGIQYIDDRLLEDEDRQQIRQWLQGLFSDISENIGEYKGVPYAVIEGEIIEADPEEKMDKYAYKDTQWYQKAVAAGGEAVFTGIYRDAKTGRWVITIAQKAQQSDSVLAIDIFVDEFQDRKEDSKLPEGGAYYICDQSGNLLYYVNNHDHSFEEIQDYVSGIMEKIKEGKLEKYSSYVRNLEGDKCGVYYYEMGNGNITILTIPRIAILNNLPQFCKFLLAAFLLVTSFVVMMTVIDYQRGRRMERANETIRVLGNSCYAIYRVNYEKGTFETIKQLGGSLDESYPKGLHPEEDRYEILLKEAKKVVEEDTWEEFLRCFSVDSIRKLVENKVHDFGGDFRRRFGDAMRWVNVRVLFDDTMEPGEVVLCFQEVDQEQKQHLKQFELLQNALKAAQKSESVKNTFFNHMSHDMRTPLNAIIGLSELSRRNLDDREKLNDYMQKIEISGRQLLGLVDDVLEISRIEHGKVSLDYKPINLKQCIKECTDVFQDQAKQEGKHFSVCYEISDALVIGDSFRLGQIINNLLSNSMKYSKTGAEIELTVKQIEYHQHMKYQIVVRDTGIGMSKEFLENIFEPYARETRFSAGEVRGTGLGMPIVKSLVQQMSGEITVESQIGKGSTVTVTIPMEIAQEEEKQDISGTEDKETGTEGGDAFSLEGKRILLVEDNEINMEIAKEILAAHEAQVTEAWNGKEAVEIFEKSEIFFFDAILMDMRMPEMDGCEAAKMIRAMSRPDSERVPIIAVTANAFAEDIAMTTEAGMNAHISKPIDFAVLCRTLDTLMRKELKEENE